MGRRDADLIDLHARELYRKLLLWIALNVLEQLGHCESYDARVCLITSHGMCLPGARLAISEDAHIVSIQCSLNDRGEGVGI